MTKSEFKKSIVDLRRKLSAVEVMKQGEMESSKIDNELYQISVELDNLRTLNED